MNLSNVFNQAERDKMWSEIVASTSHYKELQKSMEFGYVQGVVAMLNILQECESLTGKEIRETYLGMIKDSEIDKMVKRLIKYK